MMDETVKSICAEVTPEEMTIHSKNLELKQSTGLEQILNFLLKTLLNSPVLRMTNYHFNAK